MTLEIPYYIYPLIADQLKWGAYFAINLLCKIYIRADNELSYLLACLISSLFLIVSNKSNWSAHIPSSYH